MTCYWRVEARLHLKWLGVRTKVDAQRQVTMRVPYDGASETQLFPEHFKVQRVYYVS